MHAARVAHSARLRRVLAVLADGAEHSSWDLTVAALTTAPGTAVSELRANGAQIECRQEHGPEGRKFFYRMVRGPEAGK